MKANTPKLTRRGQILAGSVGVVTLGLLAWWLWLWLIPNPLLGKWVAIDKDSDPFRASVTLLGQIEFTPDRAVLAGTTLPATYTVVDRSTVLANIKTTFGGISSEKITVRRTLSGLVIQRPVPFMPDGMVEYRKAD